MAARLLCELVNLASVIIGAGANEGRITRGRANAASTITAAELAELAMSLPNPAVDVMCAASLANQGIRHFGRAYQLLKHLPEGNLHLEEARTKLDTYLLETVRIKQTSVVEVRDKGTGAPLTAFVGITDAERYFKKQGDPLLSTIQQALDDSALGTGAYYDRAKLLVECFSITNHAATLRRALSIATDECFARVGSWNMKATEQFCNRKTFKKDLVRKVKNLAHVATSEEWTAFVLQECPVKPDSGLLELLCDAFPTGWKFSGVDFSKRDRAVFGFDYPITKRGELRRQ